MRAGAASDGEEEAGDDEREGGSGGDDEEGCAEDEQQRASVGVVCGEQTQATLVWPAQTLPLSVLSRHIIILYC